MASGSDEMRPIPVVPDQDWHPHPAAFIFHRQHTNKYTTAAANATGYAGYTIRSTGT